MGKGIALEFKKKFPDMFKDYAARCSRGEVRLGEPYIYKQLTGPNVINFPTKDHWRSLSKIGDIEKGLDYLVARIKPWGVTSLAVPPLGCGSGQLEWRAIGPIIYKKLKPLNIPVELYGPYGTKPEELTASFLEGPIEKGPTHRSASVQTAISPAWVALLEVVNRLGKEPFHPPIGRVIFQKISYIATRIGLPTGLHFEPKSYGPFSKELPNVQAKLMSGNLMRETRWGSMFRIELGTEFERARKMSEGFINAHNEALEKIKDLFMRMDTAKAELVATVIFSADDLKKHYKTKPKETEVVESVMKWKQRRIPPINREEVVRTVRNLSMLNWLDVILDLPEENF